MKLFAVLPPPEMNAQGEDAVIATLCAPLPQLIDSAAALIAPELLNREREIAERERGRH